MRSAMRGASILALLITVGSCTDRQLLEPAPDDANAITPRFSSAHMPAVRISEIHYDDDGTDEGEAIEISAPAGTDLTGWSVVLYNGSNGTAYDTRTLDATVPASCDPRGVVVLDYLVNGIQNGGPDGMALVDAGNNVIEFLSYEGAMTAVDGPAAGMTSTDIAASEAGSTPAGWSLQRTGLDTWSAPAPATFGACNDEDDETPTDPDDPPPTGSLPDTRLSEIHYDNDGGDTGEAIEVEGPAGTDLTGWSLVLYNGNNGAPYNSTVLNGTIPALCDDRGVVAVTYPSNGIQNGSPDAIALVDAAGDVVEFLSYEGTMTGVGGPADGMSSTDIGVAQATSTPAGLSLQRDSDGEWQLPATASFGACNGTSTPPGGDPETGELVINELMGEPANAESASWGEWFEVFNPGTSPVDLQGWTIASGGQPHHVIGSSVIVPAGGYVVLGRGADNTRNGGVDIDYNYFTGSSTTIWLDASDWLVLRNGTGATADSVAWTGLARGATSGVRDAAIANANVGGDNWGYATVQFGAGDFGTPGAANGALSDTPPEVWTIAFFGRTAGEPPLPVGFEDQLFASLRDPLGNEVETAFTWTSETPLIASIDELGVMRALGAGTAVLRATAANGTTRTYSLPTHVATAGATAAYDGNTEFGVPADADASDDFIITRDQYTASYSHTRSTPNWVSYNLEATHFGDADRCDCFTHDPELPGGFTGVSTADYTGAGAHHGFGIDRGHLARSADRTAGSLDNAVTYYFSNIIPQAADMNQGPWAILENTLGDLARDGDSEVYIITGVAGSSGTVKDEGRIVIPESVWKVAVILPRDQGLEDVTRWSDLEIIAVMMPNTPGIRDVSWTEFDTSIDAIEAASGYDLLALLPDDVEFIIESGAHELLTVFNDVAASGALSKGEATSLGAKLNAAASSIARGQAIAAINQIGAFTNELNALRKTGRISDAVAQVLLDAANRVQQTLSE